MTTANAHPRFVLAGAYSGVGKTSLSMAILGALKDRGVRVLPYKVGPDYIDPMFHTFVTGEVSRNLDSWIVEPEALKKLFAQTAPTDGAGISLIEGVMGLYDGNGTTSEGGTAHVARTLSAPVVLVVNGEGIGRSLGALVLGYRDFDKGLNLAGVIVNRISSEKHYRLLKEVVENEAGLRCYGYLPKKNEVALAHRPLGLIPPSANSASPEAQEMCRRAETLSRLAAESIDLDGLLELAYRAPKIDTAPYFFPNRGRGVRIGVPRDAAFYAYYADNLDLLRAYGAEIVFFDATQDAALPKNLDGLYIGGGSPEAFAAALSANAALKRGILTSLENGLPAYAEGAGNAYLCRSLICSDGATYPMVGFLPYDARVTSRLPNFGHITVTLNEDTPLGTRGTHYRANEFHRLEIFSAFFTSLDSLANSASLANPVGLVNSASPAPPTPPVLATGSPSAAYSACKSNGAEWHGGCVKKNMFASLAQVHFYANLALAENFIRFVERCSRGRKSG